MKKTVKYICFIFIIALILIQSFLVLRKEFQNDTFYSIKVGDYLIHNGIKSLDIDKLSWHENLSYCNPHWLNDIVIYLSFAIGELIGIGAFTGVYILTLFEVVILGILLFYISYKESKNKWVSCIITLLTLYLLQSFLAARAQLASYILFVLEVFFIERYIKENKKRYVVGLLIIASLLANVHMAIFPIYFVLFLPYIVTEIISKFLKEDKKVLFKKIEITKNHNLRKLIFICLLAAVIGLINPSGLTPYTYTAKILQGTTMNYITEHSRVDWVYLSFNKPYLIAYGLVLLILIYPKQEVKLQDMFMLGGLTVLSFLGVRQIAIFLVITSRIFTKYVNEIKEKFLSLKIFKGEKFLVLRIGVTIMCLFFIFYGSVKFYNRYGNKDLLNESSYPVHASEWIKENLDIEKLRIFNNYADGSYLVLAGVPNFIDTRCDLYTAEFNKNLKKGEDIFEDCMIVQETKEYKKVFKKYDINACLVNKNEFCLDNLKNDEEFENVYEDEDFIVYLRKDLKENLAK